MAKRNQSQAQLDNLKLGDGFANTEIARRAQLKSAKARSEYKTLKQRIKDNVTPEQWDEMIAALVTKSMNGDVRAFEILRDTCGEKPTDKVEMDAGVSFYLDGIGDDISG